MDIDRKIRNLYAWLNEPVSEDDGKQASNVSSAGTSQSGEGRSSADRVRRAKWGPRGARGRARGRRSSAVQPARPEPRTGRSSLLGDLLKGPWR